MLGLGLSPLLYRSQKSGGLFRFTSASAQTLTSGKFTFVRASTAVQVGADGRHIVAPTNTPRIEHQITSQTAGIPLGYLSENSRASLDEASYTSGASVAPYTGPDDGDAFGINLSIISAGGTWNRYNKQFQATAGSPKAISVWTRAGTASNVRLTFRDTTGGIESHVAGPLNGTLSVSREDAGTLTEATDRKSVV